MPSPISTTFACDADVGQMTSKQAVVAFYKSHYPPDLLLMYPDFMISKYDKFEDRPAQTAALKAAHRSHLSRPLASRTPDDVIAFLADDRVPLASIFYAGW